jgi:hypothetical protein
VFPYDLALAAAVHNPPQSIPDVLQTMQTIDATCIASDGLKWFNWLYLRVTQAIEARINAGEFADPAWLVQLDIHFAWLYFSALESAITGASCPGSWEAMFGCRNNASIARIQFALAGINAHINHDLPEAVLATCRITGTVPQHGGTQYKNYTALNSTFDSLIDTAKQMLNVRLPGDPLPAVSHLEDLVGAWDVAAAREKAWINAESLWNLPPLFAAGLMESIDGFTTVIGKALLVPVPSALIRAAAAPQS